MNNTLAQSRQRGWDQVLNRWDTIGEALDRREIGPNKHWDVRPLTAQCESSGAMQYPWTGK